MENTDEHNQISKQPIAPPDSPVAAHRQDAESAGGENGGVGFAAPQMAQTKQKKPLHKKWWFWLIIVVVVLGIIGGAAGGSKEDGESPNTSESSSSTAKQVVAAASEEERAELRSVIDEAAAVDLEQYTNDTGSALTSAISEAEKVYADAGATSAAVNNAASRIKEAKSQLKERVKPVVLTGSGDDVVDVPSGLAVCLVTAEYSGGSNFVIKSLDAGGNSIDLLVNTIGEYSGTTTTGKRNGTAAFLEVKASGPWTITLSPVTDAQVITSGQQMYGDNVVLADTSGATKLDISNSGEHNFVVYGISKNSSKLLVNEIGSYSGTVVNGNYIMFIVESEGEWMISW